jgi:hypothetical protein
VGDGSNLTLLYWLRPFSLTFRALPCCCPLALARRRRLPTLQASTLTGALRTQLATNPPLPNSEGHCSGGHSLHLGGTSLS